MEWMSRPDAREHLMRKIVEEADHCVLPPSATEEIRNNEIVEVSLWGEETRNSHNGQREVQSYLYDTLPIDKHMSPLFWWKAHEKQFPRLAMLARKYLACPGSSTPSERVFSTSGDIISDSRSRMDPDLADYLIFLSSNFEMEDLDI